jgi:transposase
MPRTKKNQRQNLDIIYERCCGLDIHKNSITACIITKEYVEISTYSTMTDDLFKLCDKLAQENVQMTAMESTGSYWKPIFNIMEAREVPAILVNAHHVKNLPGRKTDVKDAEWIASLLRHGLLKASFVPSRDLRELRELDRYRRKTVEERSRELNRLDKILQGANVKLTSVVSKIDTKTTMNVVKSIIEGVEDPEKLASGAKGSLKHKTEELKRALYGVIQEHQKFILKEMLKKIEGLDEILGELDNEIERRLKEQSEIIDRLMQIPGVGKKNAESIIVEIGINMDQFQTAEQLVSWAGMCPGNNESAGVKKSGRTRKGNANLRKTLVLAGRSAGRTNTFLGAKYKRLAKRRGANKAAVAIGHEILKICFHMIKNNAPYKDLGADYYDRVEKEKIIKRHVKALEKMNFNVILSELIEDPDISNIS